MSSRDSHSQNSVPITQDSQESPLTKTVATLFGNIFAVMANEEVMAAAKPTASMDLTIKHRLMKADPAGTRFSSLQRKRNVAVSLAFLDMCIRLRSQKLFLFKLF